MMLIHTLVRWVICCGAFLLTPLLFAQSPLAIGEWQSHLPYRVGRYVTQSNDAIYYATPFSVLRIDKATREIGFISKTEGLSAAGIELIKYNRFREMLFIAYDDANIDLLKADGSVINLNSINQNSAITGEKRIRDVYIADDTYGYLACSFGVVQFNFKQEEFGSTLFTTFPVYAATGKGDSLYIATEQGIYRVHTRSNLQDFGNWQRLGSAQGLPEVYRSRAITFYNDTLYADIQDTLYKITPTSATPIRYVPGFELQYLTAEGTHLLAGFNNKAQYQDDKLVLFDANLNIVPTPGFCVNQLITGIEDEQNNLWLADLYAGFRFGHITASECNRVEYNSPHSHNASDIKIIDDKVWITTGGLSIQRIGLTLNEGLLLYDKGNWSRYNRYYDSRLYDELVHLDWLSMAVHPVSKKIYIGTFSGGLLGFDGTTFEIFNENNSSLQEGVNAAATLVAGLGFDTNHNLWLTNNYAPRPYSVYTAEGTWKNFSPPCGTGTSVYQMVVDKNNFKWSILGDSQGILVWDTGADPLNTADDKCRRLSTNNTVLPVNDINCMAVDINGDVWVGTNEGVVTFECGYGILDDNCTGSRRILDQDGFNGYLLETESVRCIAIDGANRKWFGTTNGIFVISPNGDALVAQYNTQNSPLPANGITAIAVNEKNGDVWIGTEKGLMQYRTDAIGGELTPAPKSEVYAYPNPVRPEYNGPIAIRGLARDANVKIANIAGDIVFETTALGGQAIWNGNDLSGKRAATGVYMVISTGTLSVENPNSVVTKILFVN